MKLKSQMSIFMAVTFIAFNSYAAENVAKVVIMRGMVKATLTDGTIFDVQADQSIPEGASIKTAEKSFVKLMFIDKSQMNLGPSSQMIITSFPKKEAGIITLVKGQIRSQVTKDYMEMDDKNKSKLYIKTKTAAMGIRGTDFQVNFNPDNSNTSLITFEGKVAMAHIDRAAREDNFDQINLESVVSSSKAVFVTKGQISAANLNVAERAMTPTLLGTKQAEALEQNQTGIKESTGKEDSSKQFRNPIPPGAEGSVFSSTSPELEKEAAKMGSMKSTNLEKQTTADGFFNVSTGEYKLPAGSIIDLNTVNIIPPPVNAIYDNNTGTYVVPETYGKIDKTTGEYKAPIGLALGIDGKFTVIDADAFKKSTETQEKKEEAASSKEGDVSATAAPAGVKVPVVFSGEIAQAFIVKNAEVAPTRGPASVTTTINPDLILKAKETLQKNDVAKQAATDRGVVTPKTKVKFIFNAQ